MSGGRAHTSGRGGPSAKTKLLLTPLIALATVEGVGRLFFWAQGRPYGRAETVEAIGESLDWMREHTPGSSYEESTEVTTKTTPILHPYFAWETLGGQQRVSRDLAYFRTPEADLEFDILVVGSSVAAGFSNRGRAAFEALLEQDPRFADRPIRVQRYARGAFKQPQQLMVLAYLLTLGFEPDAVVCVDGMNELATALANFKRGAHPVYPGLTQWAPVAVGGALDDRALELLFQLRLNEERGRSLARWVGRTGASYSCVLGTLARSRMARIQTDWVTAQEQYVDHVTGVDTKLALRGPEFEGDGRDALRECVYAWERSVISMAALCADRSIPFVHVLQPTLYDEGSKPLTPGEQAGANAPPEWINGAQAGYPLMREGIARLRERGLHSVDASRIFEEVEETVYVDAAHFNRAGYEVFAECVAPVFLEALGPDK